MRASLVLGVLLVAGCAANQLENEVWCVRAEQNGTTSLYAKVNGQDGFRALAVPPEPVKQLVYRNTSVLALVESGRLYSYDTASAPGWTPLLPDYGFRATAVAFARNGLILAVGQDGYLYSRAYNGWNQVPNSYSVTSIAVLPDGRVVGSGLAGCLWWTPADLSGGWERVSDSDNNCATASISIDPAGETLYGVKQGYIMEASANLSNSTWTRLEPETCCFNAVAETGSGSIYAIGQDRRLYVADNDGWQVDTDPINGSFVALMTGRPI